MVKVVLLGGEGRALGGVPCWLCTQSLRKASEKQRKTNSWWRQKSLTKARSLLTGDLRQIHREEPLGFMGIVCREHLVPMP